MANNTNILNETMLAKECLFRLAAQDSILHQASSVLSAVVHSTVGLGEVLQDYARQTTSEVHMIIRAAERLAQGNADKADQDALEMMTMTLKAICTILNATPGAMLRNKAESLGDSKINRTDVVALADSFAHAPDVVWLLEKENCGQLLAASVVENTDSSFSAQGTMDDTTTFGILN